MPRKDFTRFLRYLAPNLVTTASIVFSVLAVQATIRGEMVWGAWWGLYSTLTDKLDGIVARLLRASTPVGVQLDSLADLLNYGFVPATITYAFFVNPQHRALGWSQGLPYVALCVLCCSYVACAALRLARFNVSAANPRIFFGIPSTMAGAVVLALFVTLCKYGDPAWTTGSESYPGWRLLDHADLRAVMPWFPLVLMGFGLLMISRWRIPKLGHTGSRALDIYVVANLVVGYAAGLFHCLPEYLVFGGVQYMLISAYLHFFRTAPERPEPLFPAT